MRAMLTLLVIEDAWLVQWTFFAGRRVPQTHRSL
jgi:hypothetical protein